MVSVVVVNGASSAGKSTLVAAAQPLLPRPFLAFGLDLLLFGDALPRDAEGSLRDWTVLRPRVLAGHRRAVRAFADTGVNVITDVVLETQQQADDWDEALRGLDVLWVGLHAPVAELRRRERERGDRPSGDAERDHAVVHTFHAYDLELDSTDGLDSCARKLVSAVQPTDR
ncbi:MAG: AAA family ATPase [Propionibacteriales bacterium]|nr:AAA family ATPase [Propionibacteriales bacterium]